MEHKSIFEMITAEEAAYAVPITVIDGWDWSMKEHIRLSVLYKNSQKATGNSQADRDYSPVRNIVRPILNLRYRTEGFDVKDIALYVDDQKSYFKSFLLSKYHDRWADEQDLDEFIDTMSETSIDFGGVILKNRGKEKPDLPPLETIAFCDQTNMLGGPIGFHHFYSPSELKKMEAQGWGDKKNGATVSIEEAIVLSTESKTPDQQNGVQVKTPGKYLKVYEVHGNMPERWLGKKKNSEKYVYQLQIVAFVKDENGNKMGITLYAGREDDDTLDQYVPGKIYGRALGFGGVEELFEPQVWTNYSEQKKLEMLDAAAKVIHTTTDEAFKTRQSLQDLPPESVLYIAEGKQMNRMNNANPNFAVFDAWDRGWETHGQQMGAANDSIMGKSPSAGTPFKLQELVTMESHGLHEHRQGKLAGYTQKVYRKWIIPQMSKSLSEGKTFLAELTLEQLQNVAESLVMCETNKIIKEKIFAGEMVDPTEIEYEKERIRQAFMRGGQKKFLEILKGEFENEPIGVKVNVAGKKKNMEKMTDKVVNVFRQVIANPAVLDDPRMAAIFNQIIEYSGLSPIDFGMIAPKKVEQPMISAPLTGPASVIPNSTPSPIGAGAY